ncbi:hypothetical protein PRIPAC_85551 [Pristionchus pacificus]|uniref:Uncharacterized protein n=1 Tax=Pristionchus pacificus TaxID=54126 RepID=A0A2A6CES0_PRIPA|nr:hypothetical protein PRIPAC_85551 [Pristionchus pacificus]|eukprot:PDM76587.1 hypothetical protein PRIPAC_42953 [Pristionchus pacificus]
MIVSLVEKVGDYSVIYSQKMAVLNAQCKLSYGSAHVDGELKQIRELFKRNDDLAQDIAQMNERINPIKRLFAYQNKPILIPLLNIPLLVATIATFLYGPSAWSSAYAQVARAYAWAADAAGEADGLIASPDVATEINGQ